MSATPKPVEVLRQLLRLIDEAREEGRVLDDKYGSGLLVVGDRFSDDRPSPLDGDWDAAESRNDQALDRFSNYLHGLDTGDGRLAMLATLRLPRGLTYASWDGDHDWVIGQTCWAMLRNLGIEKPATRNSSIILDQFVVAAAQDLADEVQRLAGGDPASATPGDVQTLAAIAIGELSELAEPELGKHIELSPAVRLCAAVLLGQWSEEAVDGLLSELHREHSVPHRVLARLIGMDRTSVWTRLRDKEDIA